MSQQFMFADFSSASLAYAFDIHEKDAQFVAPPRASREGPLPESVIVHAELQAAITDNGVALNGRALIFGVNYTEIQEGFAFLINVLLPTARSTAMTAWSLGQIMSSKSPNGNVWVKVRSNDKRESQRQDATTPVEAASSASNGKPVRNSCI